MVERKRIIPINIEEEMKSSYIDYSMSVIVSRALPDVRDGMKPVHRRVLYGMYELGVLSNRSYKKSARIVGEVLGKFHPHGDSSVYDTMVRMAQPWSLRYMLVDGQGNFGSVDGDPPAAMRYTEARLQKISEEMLADIDKETVSYQLNFDDSLQEPTVLPTRIPNLLINGASGIAVGMATNMPPHNLSESIAAAVAYIDDKNIDIEGLMNHITAPDFPSEGIIYGYEGVKEAYETGRGRIVVRGKAILEEVKGLECIVVTEIPYQVNKAEMIRKTAELVNDKRIEGITNIKDESDRKGMRIVYYLKRDVIPNVVLNKLYKYTSLQSSFSVNNITLVNGRPQRLNLKDLIRYFVDHRHDVVLRRTQYELRKAKERVHILEGLLVALYHLDEIIALIKNSHAPEHAKNGLMNDYDLTETQAKAILDLRLQRLTGLEREKIQKEHDELIKKIAYYERILKEEKLRMQIIKEELLEIKEKYDDERRTKIDFAGGDLSIEDIIPNEKVVITISHASYIKRTPLTKYKKQSRGGIGHRGVQTRGEDFIEHILIATNHNYMLFFTEWGRCYWLKVYEIPEGGKSNKGRAIQNLIDVPLDDKIKAFINTGNLKDEEYINKNYIVMVTQKGIIKKTSLEAYSRPRSNGINAITIREGDMLLGAVLTSGKDEIIIAAKSGKAIRFNEENVRPTGRNASGVKGINLASEADKVIGVVTVGLEQQANILVVSEKGYGKRSALKHYRIIKRGGKGVKTLNITDKTGDLVAIKAVTDKDNLIIIKNSGIMIRIEVEKLRIKGRLTQGVRLINLKDGDKIASVTKVSIAEKEMDVDEI